MATTMEHASNAMLAFKPCQKARGGMTFYPLATLDGGELRLLLGPIGSFPATIPFEPNVFGGSGGEPRKAIRFAIPDENGLGDLRNLEQKAQDLPRGAAPKTNWNWNSAITEFRPVPAKLEGQHLGVGRTRRKHSQRERVTNSNAKSTLDAPYGQRGDGRERGVPDGERTGGARHPSHGAPPRSTGVHARRSRPLRDRQVSS